MPSIRGALVGGIALCAVVGSGACHRRAAVRASPSNVSPDSVSGTLSVTGTTFEEQFMLRSTGGMRRLRATARDSASLVRLGNVEMVVYGSNAADAFTVVSFRAVRVDGQAVVDGTLRLDGDHYVLEALTGRLQINRAPAAFPSLVGARLWIVVPEDGSVVYGVIRPAK